MSIHTSVSGFAVIPVLYNSSTTHHLYARSHTSGKGKAKAGDFSPQRFPDGRTLFLVNVPPDATERELGLFFKHAGTVEKVLYDFDAKEAQNEGGDSDSEQEENDVDEDVEMNDEDADDSDASAPRRKRQGKQKSKEAIPRVIPLPAPSPSLRKLRKTGRSAHIIFLDNSSLERALASTSKPRSWPSLSTEEPSGLAHYKGLYGALRPPLDSIKAFADSSMDVYEYNVQKEKQKSKYKKGEAIVDEDGFTLVTRGGAYGKTLGGGVAVASKKFQRSVGQSRNRGEKKRDRAEKEGFYAFQKAEKQRSDLMELKRKWEDDKLKVEKLKAARRFKPY